MKNLKPFIVTDQENNKITLISSEDIKLLKKGCKIVDNYISQSKECLLQIRDILEEKFLDSSLFYEEKENKILYEMFEKIDDKISNINLNSFDVISSDYRNSWVEYDVISSVEDIEYNYALLSRWNKLNFFHQLIQNNSISEAIDLLHDYYNGWSKTKITTLIEAIQISYFIKTPSKGFKYKLYNKCLNIWVDKIFEDFEDLLIKYPTWGRRTLFLIAEDNRHAYEMFLAKNQIRPFLSPMVDFIENQPISLLNTKNATVKLKTTLKRVTIGYEQQISHKYVNVYNFTEKSYYILKSKPISKWVLSKYEGKIGYRCIAIDHFINQYEQSTSYFYERFGFSSLRAFNIELRKLLWSEIDDPLNLYEPLAKCYVKVKNLLTQEIEDILAYKDICRYDDSYYSVYRIITNPQNYLILYETGS